MNQQKCLNVMERIWIMSLIETSRPVSLYLRVYGCRRAALLYLSHTHNHCRFTTGGDFWPCCIVTRKSTRKTRKADISVCGGGLTLIETVNLCVAVQTVKYVKYILPLLTSDTIYMNAGSCFIANHFASTDHTVETVMLSCMHFACSLSWTSRLPPNFQLELLTLVAKLHNFDRSWLFLGLGWFVLERLRSQKLTVDGFFVQFIKPLFVAFDQSYFNEHFFTPNA